MEDTEKSKSELIQELEELRKIDQSLKTSEAELKKLEEALLESQKIKKALFNAPNDVIWVLDPDGFIIDCNEIAARRMGTPVDQLIGVCVLDILPAELAKSRKYWGEQAIQTGESIRFEDERGGVKFDNLIYPIRNGEGKVSGIVVNARDITENKQAKQALLETREKYQALVETTNDFIWETDTIGRYTYCSPQMKTLWGFDPQEMVGKTPFDQMSLDEGEKGSQFYKEITMNPKPFTIQAGFFDAARNNVAIEVSGVPFYDSNGKLMGYRGITRDITDRKKAEDALRHRTEELQTVLDTTPVAIFMAQDPECGKITGNPAAQELLNLPPEANISKTAPAGDRPTQWQEMRDGVLIEPVDLPLQRAVRGEKVRTMKWTWSLRTEQ